MYKHQLGLSDFQLIPPMPFSRGNHHIFQHLIERCMQDRVLLNARLESQCAQQFCQWQTGTFSLHIPQGDIDREIACTAIPLRPAGLRLAAVYILSVSLGSSPRSRFIGWLSLFGVSINTKAASTFAVARQRTKAIATAGVSAMILPLPVKRFRDRSSTFASLTLRRSSGVEKQ